MTVRVADILTDVRTILQDKAHGDVQRNTDIEIRAALRIALMDVRRLRPDAFSIPTAALPNVETATELDLEEWMHSSLVYLAAGFILSQNSELTRAGAAGNLMALGRNQLTGVA